MHDITQATPDIQRKLQNLESGPQTSLSTLIEEAFKVCNSQELTVVANKDRRLIKKKCCYSPATFMGPWSAETKHRAEKLHGLETVCLLSEGGHWNMGGYPECLPVECPQDNPNWPQFLLNL